MAERYVVPGLGGFEAWYNLTKRAVTCRVAHVCCWCQELIRSGARAEMSTHLFIDEEGRHFVRQWLHEECSDVMADAVDDLEDAYELYREWVNGAGPIF